MKFDFSIIKKILFGMASMLISFGSEMTLAKDSMEKIDTVIENNKIIIAYYSYSGVTKKVAEEICEMVGGYVFEIQTIDAYPSDYRSILKQSEMEIGSGYKPTLKNSMETLSNYDVIFIGFPVWHGTIAPPVVSFLSAHNLAGKTIIPFCTHGGGGAGNSFKAVSSLSPDSKILTGGVFLGNPKEEISRWVKSQLDQLAGKH
jgi:flavodoxin